MVVDGVSDVVLGDCCDDKEVGSGYEICDFGGGLVWYCYGY